MLICPKCKEKLIKNEKTYSCVNRHSYDIAKKGYVNLVLGNQKNSGDSSEMVKARTLFLDKGHYQPLSKEINALLEKYHASVVVDAGCGEGYYTSQMYESVPDATITGFDLSKAGLNEACKRDKRTTYAISSIFDLPIADDSCDALVNIFAPVPFKEAERILKSGGVMIIAGPGKEHLLGLKEKLYSQVYENEVADEEYAGFELVEKKHLKYSIQCTSSEEIEALFMMTPYYWKTSKEASDRLKTCTTLETLVEFVVYCYRKK